MHSPLNNGKKKRPNSRHFYLFKDKKDGSFKSGLTLDNVQLDNTVIVPVKPFVIDEDVRLINEGLANYKKLVFLKTQNMHKLALPLAIGFSGTVLFYFSLSIILPIIFDRPNLHTLNYSEVIYAILIASLSLIFVIPAYWLIFFILINIIKFFCLFIGLQRIKVFKFIFNFLFVFFVFIAIGTAFMSNEDIDFEKKANFFQFFLPLFFVTGLMMFTGIIISCFLLQLVDRFLIIEHEWIINKKVYGEHLNQDNIPVLFPKRGKGFYNLDPQEYRKLMAYQQSNGDPKKTKALLNMWTTKPIIDPKKAKIYRLERLNPVKIIVIFISRIIVSLLALLFECCDVFLTGIIGRPAVIAVRKWLKVRGINKVYWIYTECEAATKTLIVKR